MSETSITFSVITPTTNKAELLRASKSIVNQTFTDWEHIIINDGLPETEIDGLIGVLYPEGRVQYIKHKERMERLISYNDGLKVAKGEWIVFLDDDDEYVPFFLEYLASEIAKYPDFKVFNYGGLVTNKKAGWIRARNVVEFEQKLEAKVESGMIVNGQFCFHRSCLEKTGLFPPAKNCYQFADLAGIPGYNSKVRTLGNPWGQDFYLFYKLTRHFISKPLNLYLYICHIRGTE